MARPPAVARRRRRPSRWGAAVGVALAVSLAPPVVAVAGAANPVPRTTPAAVESEPVRYGPAAGTAAARTPAPSADATSDLTHIVAALAIVVVLILGLRWVARKLSLVPTAGRPGRGVRLLSRTVLSPKQQVLLLQVGRRLVLVGDGGGAGLRPLCEITDPDEVAALIGDVRSAEAATPASRSFGSLFKRAAEPFADDAVGSGKPAMAPPDADVSSDVVGLLDKVRGLRQQFDR